MLSSRGRAISLSEYVTLHEKSLAELFPKYNGNTWYEKGNIHIIFICINTY